MVAYRSERSRFEFCSDIYGKVFGIVTRHRIVRYSFLFRFSCLQVQVKKCFNLFILILFIRYSVTYDLHTVVTNTLL